MIVDGRLVRVTSPERVLYPTGFTKADLIAYYDAVAPALVPHIEQRPMTMRRFPEGVWGNTWFQTRCRGRPEWVQTHPVRIRTGEIHDYCLLNDRASLLWAANMSAIELHPFLWRAPVPRPTAVVLDLDPGEPADLSDCCRVALRAREHLDALGLAAFAKTSGSRGLHVYVPLGSDTSFDDGKAFARALARRLRDEDPARVTDVMGRAERGGKVFIDWSQNDRGKSTVAPYSLRARRRPTVSTPVTWDEVRRGGELAFGPDEVRARLERSGDLFAPVLELTQRLPA